MSFRARIVLGIIAGSLFLAMTIGVAYTTASIMKAGTITVEIMEREEAHVALRVPAALVRMGLLFVPDEALAEAGGELRRWWPALRKAVRELSGSPDATFLNVSGPDCDVILGKKNDLLYVRVESSEESIHVAVPLSTLDSILDRLDRLIPTLPSPPAETESVHASLRPGPALIPALKNPVPTI